MSIHFSDDTVQTKLDFLTQHRDQIHIVTDFDATLTQYFDHHGKSRPSIISLLRDENILDEEYSSLAHEMYSYYSAIEHDPSLDKDLKMATMNERWTKHKELLMKKWLNMHHLEHIATMDRIVMRSGTDIFLKRAEELGIPVIIFSASGIGYDSIRLLLQHRWLLLPNIHIVSNKLYRDSDGRMVGFDPNIIHSLNKTESVIRWSDEYRTIQEAIGQRPHALVIGDGIADAGMVDARDGRIVVTVGLCNHHVEEKYDHYMKAFDIVIANDDGLDALVSVCL